MKLTSRKNSIAGSTSAMTIPTVVITETAAVRTSETRIASSPHRRRRAPSR
jgi:hypothetical protein